uniref:Uncharacterized protein n=1 Tax=Ciona savignyi TaxID=51511 RepID=H2ZCZ3_CIOSA
MITWLESPSFIYAVSVVIGLVTLSILVYQNWWKLPHPRYPSGVRGIPVLGALPFLGEMPHTVLQRWSCEKYGPVMSVRLGPNDAVVLNDYDTITEALVKHRSIFQLRPQLKIITDYSKGYGFGFSDGHKQYLEVRQFTLKALRGIGIGKRKMEVRVFDVAQELVQTLHDLKGKAIDLKMVVNPVVCNVISSVVFGRTFERNDKAFLKIVKSIADR